MILRTLKFLGLKGLGLVLLFVLVFAVSLQNVEPVEINVLFWPTLTVSKIHVLLACVFIGVLMGVLLTLSASYPSRRRQYEQLQQLKRELAEARRTAEAKTAAITGASHRDQP